MEEEEEEEEAREWSRNLGQDLEVKFVPMLVSKGVGRVFWWGRMLLLLLL